MNSLGNNLRNGIRKVPDDNRFPGENWIDGVRSSLGSNLPNGKVPDDYTVPEENWIHGVRYTAAMTPDLMSRYPEFPVHKDYGYICSYPKSGTIWSTTVVSAILQQDDLDSWLKEPLGHFIRHIELRYEDALKLQHPSCFYTHLPYHILPTGVKDKDVKMVHISRDPKDVAVSYYHFHKNMKNYGPWNSSWDVFYDNFISGQVAFGSYFSFVSTYWEQKNNQHVMNIQYENLKRDPKTWIGKVAEFLGKPLDPEKLEKLVDLTSFKNMKKTPSINIETYLKCETECGPRTPLLTPGGSLLSTYGRDR